MTESRRGERWKELREEERESPLPSIFTGSELLNGELELERVPKTLQIQLHLGRENEETGREITGNKRIKQVGSQLFQTQALKPETCKSSQNSRQATVPRRCRPSACCTSQRRSVSVSPPCERTADTACLWHPGKRTPAGQTDRQEDRRVRSPNIIWSRRWQTSNGANVLQSRFKTPDVPFRQLKYK